VPAQDITRVPVHKDFEEGAEDNVDHETKGAPTIELYMEYDNNAHKRGLDPSSDHKRRCGDAKRCQTMPVMIMTRTRSHTWVTATKLHHKMNKFTARKLGHLQFKESLG
jgi:hypothetical protein